MSKNPSISNEGGEKEGPVLTSQTVKPYCPETMIRHDNMATEYKTVWMCKLCVTVLLSENATRAHVIKCNKKTKKLASNSQPKKDDVIGPNICSTCNRVIPKSMSMERHLEDYEKPPSGLESEESDNEMVHNIKDEDIVEADLVKKEYLDALD